MVGDDRAETYLRLLAETELRRVLRLPGRMGQRYGEPDPVRPPPWAFGTRSEIAGSVAHIWWVGDVLVTVGLLGQELGARIAAELDVALTARAGPEPSGRATRLSRALERAGTRPPGAPGESRRPAQPMQSTPIGRTLRVANERAPSELHLMTLVRTPASAAIAAMMRMSWPSDGSSADLEITGAGPQHLPYDQLWAVDDRGTRYRLQLVGEGGTAAWHGTAELSPAPPPGARWLDLIADETRRLVRLDLARPEAAATAVRSTAERSPGAPPGERLLGGLAEQILASAGDTGGASADPNLGEIIAVLTAAGALAPDSPTPGHLAAVCQRLGAQGHGITAPARADIPVRWASVLAGLDRGPAGPGPEWYAPLAAILPDVDQTRFALGGLTSAAGQSHLHVAATGVPLPAGGRDPGFSWWLRDDDGAWHVGTQSHPYLGDSGQTAFRVRLTPPLGARPEEIEVVVTGWLNRVRAVVPVPRPRGMPDN